MYECKVVRKYKSIQLNAKNHWNEGVVSDRDEMRR